MEKNQYNRGMRKQLAAWQNRQLMPKVLSLGTFIPTPNALAAVANENAASCSQAWRQRTLRMRA